MSEILANKLSPSTGTTVTLGDSGDTFNIPSGVTLTNNGTLNASAITAGTLPIARGGTGSSSTTFVNAATNITGNLPVANLNGGASASSSTFWRGDGSWEAAPAGVSLSGSTNNTVATVTGSNALAGEADLQFTGQTLTVGTTNNGVITSNFELQLVAPSNEGITFDTNGLGSEKMRIASGGDVMIGTTNPNARFHVTRSDNGTTAYVHATNASYSVNNLQSAVNRFTADNSYRFFYCVNSDNVKMQVIDSGAVQNAPNSYGGISDERTKQDITDASSQWEDIKALKVRKYKLKCDVALDGENAQSQIGVVSQELEASGMSGLVLESDSTAQDVKLHSDFGSIDEKGVFTQGQKVKAVKYSVLYMKAIKALQESMERIEQLEAKVTALESA
jgi:hypothetical protein